MNRNLPPFPAVRAFEAAARHLSFKRAAEELHVTQSAISHQIKALEHYLGQPLFRRAKGGVVLTDAGKTCLPEIGKALDRLESCTDSIRERDVSGVIEIITTPAFAGRWLISRLGEFRDIYPALDVRLATTIGGVDLERDRADVAIWYGKESGTALQTDAVLRSALYPICSPDLISGGHALRNPQALRHHTLLHGDRGEAWTQWSKDAGNLELDVSRGIRFDDCNLMIEAAIEGQGIALAFKSLVTRELTEGRLVCPFDLPMEPASWYYLITPQEWVKRPKIRAFREWILQASSNEHALAATG